MGLLQSFEDTLKEGDIASVKITFIDKVCEDAAKHAQHIKRTTGRNATIYEIGNFTKQCLDVITKKDLRDVFNFNEYEIEILLSNEKLVLNPTQNWIVFSSRFVAEVIAEVTERVHIFRRSRRNQLANKNYEYFIKY